MVYRKCGTTLNVDFSPFSYTPKELKAEWLHEIAQVVDGGMFIGGNGLFEFEDAWSKYTGSSYSVGVSNGLDGLVLALRSLNVHHGDIVAVPAHTFIATWNAIISVGATPIGVDVDENGLMDLAEFTKIYKKVKAVIPVHMHGATVDMAKLNEICSSQSSKKIYVVEDASQAHGSRSPDGSQLGKFSDLVVYSLYPTKNLGALGDAGVVTTDKKQLADRIRSLSNYGQSKDNKYFHSELGYNNRLDPIQASVLKVNLSKISDWNNKRIELSNIYLSELSDSIDILQINRRDSVRHHFCVLTPDRDDLQRYLISRGIKTEIHYPRVAGIEANYFLGTDMRFPNSEKIANETLSLPLSQWHNSNQVQYVASQVKAWTRR